MSVIILPCFLVFAFENVKEKCLCASFTANISVRSNFIFCICICFLYLYFHYVFVRCVCYHLQQRHQCGGTQKHSGPDGVGLINKAVGHQNILRGAGFWCGNLILLVLDTNGLHLIELPGIGTGW